MDLASRIGANPAKAMSRSNISFLGKGPTKNPLFQNRLAGLENATKENLGKPEALFGAIEDAVGWAKDGKLNSIQTEILGHNLSGINKILNPPPLPTASVIPIRGIGSLKSDPKFSEFFGYPKHSSGKRMSTRELIKWRETNPTEYDAWRAAMKRRADESANRLIMEGRIPDARGRTWNLRAQETGPERYNRLTGLGNVLNAKTGMSRAIARQILQQDTRLKLKPEELFMLKEGKGEPLDLMRKYYGKSMMNLDSFLDDVIPRPDMNIKDIASRVLAEVELIPQFAQGGLARILEL
jgi:hypothetical protein